MKGPGLELLRPQRLRPAVELLRPQRLRRVLGAASCVRERASFTRAELRTSASTGVYRLREGELRIVVRHPLLDMWVVEEVFRFGAYEPPAPVGERLAGLGRPPRILDLGGHIGCFGLFARSRFPDCEITSLEPDPRNAEVLARCIELNGLEARWTLVRAAAACSDGEAGFDSSFHLSRLAGAGEDALQRLQQGIAGAFPFLADSPLLEAERVTVPRQDVLPRLERADLVKIDIEGGEWEILLDPRFTRLGAVALVLEYHPAYAPVPDAEELMLATLREAGFTVGTPARGTDGATLWAWREPASS